MCMNNKKNKIKYTNTLCKVRYGFIIVYFLVNMCDLLRLMSYAFLYTIVS